MEDSRKKKTYKLKDWIYKHKVYLLILVCLVFVVYANSLGNGFVADDRGILLHIDSLDTIADNPNTLFRSLVYFIVYKAAGFNAMLMRIPNILFHLGSVLLVFFILSRKSTLLLALFASSLFAVHPILVESVTWISGGVYAQYSFLFLLSFVFYIFGKKNHKFYAISLALFALMLVTSEKSIALALVFPLYEFSFGGLRANWKKALSYLFLSGVSVIFNFTQVGQRRQYFVSDSPPDQLIMNPFQQIPIAITSYLELIFWPDKLTLYHSEMTFSQLEFVARLVIFTAFLGVIVYCFIKNRLLFFWFCFLFVFLALTLTPLGITWIVAERYIYLGALGIFVPVAWVFAKLMKTKLKEAAVAVFIIIILGFSIRTIVRNVDWHSEDNLWLSAARTSPSSPQNHNNLGDYYGRQGDIERAIQEFKKAIELKPNYADAYHNLGNAYRDRGDTAMAIENYQKALAFNPAIWQTYQNMAAIYYQQGEFDKAREYIEKGVEIDPKNPNLRLLKGLIYIKTNQRQEARELLLEILKFNPTNQLAKQGLDELDKLESIKDIQ